MLLLRFLELTSLLDFFSLLSGWKADPCILCQLFTKQICMFLRVIWCSDRGGSLNICQCFSTREQVKTSWLSCAATSYTTSVGLDNPFFYQHFPNNEVHPFSTLSAPLTRHQTVLLYYRFGVCYTHVCLSSKHQVLKRHRELVTEGTRKFTILSFLSLEPIISVSYWQGFISWPTRATVLKAPSHCCGSYKQNEEKTCLLINGKLSSSVAWYPLNLSDYLVGKITMVGAFWIPIAGQGLPSVQFTVLNVTWKHYQACLLFPHEKQGPIWGLWGQELPVLPSIPYSDICMLRSSFY